MRKRPSSVVASSLLIILALLTNQALLDGILTGTHVNSI